MSRGCAAVLVDCNLRGFFLWNHSSFLDVFVKEAAINVEEFAAGIGVSVLNRERIAVLCRLGL